MTDLKYDKIQNNYERATLKHKDPYKILDHTNQFEKTENSSHPEMHDTRRVWKCQGRTFRTATEVEKFMKNEGLNPRDFSWTPHWENRDGDDIIVIDICWQMPGFSQSMGVH